MKRYSRSLLYHSLPVYRLIWLLHIHVILVDKVRMIQNVKIQGEPYNFCKCRLAWASIWGRQGGHVPCTFWSGGDANTFVPSTFCDLKLNSEVTEKLHVFYGRCFRLKYLSLASWVLYYPYLLRKSPKIFARSARFQSHWCTYYKKRRKHFHIFIALYDYFICLYVKADSGCYEGAQHSVMQRRGILFAFPYIWRETMFNEN